MKKFDWQGMRRWIVRIISRLWHREKRWVSFWFKLSDPRDIETLKDHPALAIPREYGFACAEMPPPIGGWKAGVWYHVTIKYSTKND